MRAFTLFSFLFLFSHQLLCDENEYNIDRLDWEKSLKNNTPISIVNLYGNVHIKKSNNDSFVFHAVTQNHKSRKSNAKLIVKTDKHQISLNIVFPNNTIIGKERADVAILVPKNIHLNITMDGDQLNAKKINFPIKIISETTNINLSTSEKFDIFSKNGELNLKLLGNSTKQSSKIQSHNGNIIVQYGESQPYFDIISGKKVVSNSAQLLQSKKQSKRTKFFNNSESSIQIKIVNDTGRIILINEHIN